MIRAHKIRLYPNNAQATHLAKACGVARFAYNWALSIAKTRYEQDHNYRFNEASLRKELNSVKKEQFPWMLEVTKCAPQLAIKNNLNNAFQNYFAHRAGFPKFCKKGVNDSFALSNDQLKLKGMTVKVPNLGWVRLAEELRYSGKILAASISRRADRWYIAIQVEIPDKPKTISENQAIGVDLGVKTKVTLSDGSKIDGAKASASNERKLRRLNQSLSRKQGARKGEKQSSNFRKAKERLARLYARIAAVRLDDTHQLTTMLTESYSLIGIEDLNVKGMMENHRLARSIADMSFYEFRRQLEYKAEASGSIIVTADQWYPSSKLCSVCQSKNEELQLSDRQWQCSSCHTVHDRDVNAARNLREYAVQMHLA